MKEKHQNIQPWLDYFQLLKTYESRGLLEIHPDMYEAFTTAPAVCSLAENGREPKDHDAAMRLFLSRIPAIAHRIQAYAAFKMQGGYDYMQSDFALHVVKDEPPHDALYTVILTHRRRWWWPWRKTEHVETIIY